MKSISPELAAHLSGEVTTLACLWRIVRRDGHAFFFTDHDRDIVFEGDAYRAATGYSRSAIANEAGLAVDNLDVEGVFDSEQITEADLRAGLFDHAEVSLLLVNWADPDHGGVILRRGWFGEVQTAETGIFRTELRGLAQALSQRIAELYSPECRADLGDHRCRVPIDPPAIARDTAYAIGDVVKVARVTTAVETWPLPLINPGFDTGDLTGWQTVTGSAQAKTQNGALAAHGGSHFLEGGSVASFEIRQTVDLTAVLDAAILDTGRITFDCACFRANGATDSVDQGRVILELLDASDTVLATAWDTGFESFGADGTWHLRSVSGASVPAGSRTLRIRFLGQRLSGTVCNAALDSVSATLTDPEVPLVGSAVYENRIYVCTTAGTTAMDAPAYDPTLGTETTDDTAVFVAQESWTRHGVVAAVIDRRRFTVAIDEPRAVDGWFAGGVLAWETGANAGRAMEVKDWAASGAVTLFLPMADMIVMGDHFSISPGCDKRLATCAERFGNVLNFRGEPYVPGQDALMTYPDAH